MAKPETITQSRFCGNFANVVCPRFQEFVLDLVPLVGLELVNEADTLKVLI